MTRGILLFCIVMILLIGCLCTAIVFIAAPSWTNKERAAVTEIVPTYEFRNTRWGLVSKSGLFTMFDIDVLPLSGMSDGLVVYLDIPSSVSGGVIDASGKRTHLHWRISRHTKFTDGMAPAQALEMTDGSYPFFYIDRFGRKVIKTPFFIAEPFSEGLAAVVPISEATVQARKSASTLRNEWWGYIDTKGKTVIAPSYSEAGQFSAGRAIVRRVRPDFDTIVIDNVGKNIFKANGIELKPFSKDGLAVFSPLGIKGESEYPRCGLLDINGKVHASMIPFLNFSEGLGLLARGDDMSFVTVDGKHSIPVSKENLLVHCHPTDIIMSEGLAAVPIKKYRMKDTSYRGYPMQNYRVALGFIDREGKPLPVKLPDDRVMMHTYPFSDGYSVVQTAIPVEELSTVSKSPANKTN